MGIIKYTVPGTVPELLNERVSILIDKVNRMDDDMRKMNERIIRLETLIEVAKMGVGRKEIESR